MRNLLIACLLVGGAGLTTAARANPEPADHTPIALETKADVRAEMDRQLSDAAMAERQASKRVFYYEQATTIAERDLATAELRQQTAEQAWTAAVRREDPNEAGKWARAHAEAVVAQREALGRLTLDRAERDMARVAFQQKVDELHQIATRQQRVKRQLTNSNRPGRG